MLRALLFILGLAWASLVGGGLFALGRYDAAPGKAAAAPVEWPAGGETAAAVTRPTRPALLVFLHPRCPCSRATVRELAEVLARQPDRADVRVYMMRPEGTDAGFERTPLWDQAAELPGATVEADVDGAAARRFGAATSGQVLLYTGDGRLTFAGGVTAARGHVGDNPGRQALCAALESTAATAAQDANAPLGGPPAPAAVFGCALFTPGQCVRPAAPRASCSPHEIAP